VIPLPNKKNTVKKIIVPIAIVLIALTTVVSCKALAKAALKHWSKKQVKEFVANCEDKSAKFVGEENAAKFCNCAVDVVAEKYHNYEDAKSISIMEIVKIANDCK
jgi:Na+/alanine symporter